MQGNFRCNLFGDSRRSKILNEQRIDIGTTQKFYVIGKFVKLLVGNDRVYCDVNRHAAQMSIFDGCGKLFAGKVLCIGTRAKFFARQVDSVRARLDRRPQRLETSRRC